MYRLALLVLVAVLGVGFYFTRHTGIQDHVESRNVDEPGTTAAKETIPVPRISVAPRPTVEHQVEKDRLYDVSYLSDPTILELAEADDVTPECYINRWKYRYGDKTASTDICFRVSFKEHTLRSTPAYAEMTNDQLTALAVSDPVAAIELGSRARYKALEDKAVMYYERAVALSGKAGPLSDLAVENAFDWSPEENAAKVYEFMLVAYALGQKNNIDAYREFVLEKGIDPASIEQRAQERLQRITALRHELVGRPWGES